MSISSSSSSSAASSSADELVDDLSNNELESWREVHGLLIKAVLVAREAVAAKKAQRRFWLEEIWYENVLLIVDIAFCRGLLGLMVSFQYLTLTFLETTCFV